ncbi:MAG: SGNH/GDSL hydrolase family protein, partial [Candidatus Binatia bacterium]
LHGALLLFAVLSGCGVLFHKPRPQPDAAPAWGVRCAWEIPARAAATIEAPTIGRTWARETGGRRLLVDGGLEDGFLRVDALRAVDDSASTVALPPSWRAVNDACAATVRAQHGGAASVYEVFAAREGEDVPVTMAFPPQPGGPRITRLVLFGDSLSDSGNLKQRLEVFPAAPYWLGRFANGPNWVDRLARDTDLAVQNHSFGGAVSAPLDDIPAVDVLAAIQAGGQRVVTGSIDRYIDDYIRRDLAGGALRRPRETLFVLWAGANDYLSKEPFGGDIATLLDSPSGAAGYREAVDTVVAATVDQVRRLHAAGARHFMVATLPDLGRMPLVLHNTSYQPRGVRGEDARRAQLSRKLSALTAAHNAALRRALAQLATALPDATVADADAARMFASMIASRALRDRAQRFDYGFDLASLARTLQDAQGAVGVQDRCYRGGYLGSRDPHEICPEVARIFFWDAVHPSAYAHCWIGWFVQTELARHGLRSRAPSVQEARRRCETTNPALPKQSVRTTDYTDRADF